MDWLPWLGGLLVIVAAGLVMIAVIISCWVAAKINQERGGDTEE